MNRDIEIENEILTVHFEYSGYCPGDRLTPPCPEDVSITKIVWRRNNVTDLIFALMDMEESDLEGMVLEELKNE